MLSASFGTQPEAASHNNANSESLPLMPRTAVLLHMKGECRKL